MHYLIILIIFVNGVFSDTLLSKPGRYSIIWQYNDANGNSSVISQTVNIKKSLKLFLWTQSVSDTNKYGYYSNLLFNNKTDSSFEAELSISSSWWINPCDVNINVYKSKPTVIKKCSKRFDNVLWLKNITGTFKDTNYTFSFVFPLLSDTVKYVPYDYFAIRYNDTMNMEFCFINDSIAIGSMINDTGKTIIYARDAICILTSKNVFRMKSFQIKGEYKTLISSFLNINLTALKNDAKHYGIELLETK